MTSIPRSLEALSSSTRECINSGLFFFFHILFMVKEQKTYNYKSIKHKAQAHALHKYIYPYNSKHAAKIALVLPLPGGP